MQNKKIIVSVIYIVTGIISIVLSSFNLLEQSFLIGFGCALIGVGLMLFIKSIKCISDEEYRKQMDIEETDERNKYIVMVTWSYVGKITVILFAMGAVIFKFIGNEFVENTLAYSACAILIIYYITFLVIKKKY